MLIPLSKSVSNLPEIPDIFKPIKICEIQVLPVIQNEKCIGIIFVGSRDEPFTEIDNRYIKLLTNYFVERVYSLLIQKRAFEILHTKATYDYLTGILNRGTVLECFETMLALAKRNMYPLSIIFIDIDYFKVINDSFGHQTGDKILREVAERLSKETRESDVIGRYGGEEFLIVLNHCNRAQVAIAAERFHKAVASKPFLSAGIEPSEIKVTISLGTASTDKEDSYNLYALIKEADNALYKSKLDGRNRITLGTPLTCLC